MSSKMFVNFSVADVRKSMEFYTKIGFTLNPQYSDQNAACMGLNDEIYVMLLAKNYFKTFIKKEITDSTKMTEVIVAITVDSDQIVDEIVNTALTAGGFRSNDKIQRPGMYSWSFQDPDGHLWEVFHMATNVNKE
jgi:uncharacterized protein